MESKLKAQAMDSVGELPAGYLHLPTTPIKQAPKAGAWNDAGTWPSKIGLYETRLPHDENVIYYQVWRGKYWVFPHGTKEGALSAFGISNVQDVQWREVQP